MNGDELTFWVNLHAILMLALPVGTLAFLVLADRQKPQPRHLLTATLAAGFVCLTGLSCRHRCNQGDPFFQWVIPAGCVWLIVLLVADRIYRLSIATLVFVAGVVLCLQYSDWVHRAGWTGNPEGMRLMEKNWPVTMIREAEEFLVKNAATDATDYSAGWLKDLPPIKAAEESNELYLGNCPGLGEYTSLWHSGFTQLYRAKAGTGRDLWYLGGPIKNAKGRIVVRERPTESASPPRSTSAPD